MTRHGPRLGDLSEQEVLAAVLQVYRQEGVLQAPAGSAGSLLVPAGDDAAVVAAPSGSVVVTTDSMVRGRDWRDEWSSGHDVGVKVLTQNVADVAAMGARPTAVVVALAADPEVPLAWVLDLARGIAGAAGEAGALVAGGDLSSAPEGVVLVAVTALGDLEGRPPVLRSGARAGDVVAVCGTLGRSGSGLELLRRGRLAASGQKLAPAEAAEAAAPAEAAEAVRVHRAPRAPVAAGPLAAAAGATAMIDLSDGLVRDLGRVATASAVGIELSGAVLHERFAAGPLTDLLGEEEAMRQVLSGGEEHCLLATFVSAEALPSQGPAWFVLGQVTEGPVGRVTVDGAMPAVLGWDHFAGHE